MIYTIYVFYVFYVICVTCVIYVRDLQGWLEKQFFVLFVFP